MGIVLLVVVVLISIVLTVRAWKGYATELRKNMSTGNRSDSFDPLPFADSSSTETSIVHPSLHGDFSCGESHHSPCDVGGHGGFDAGHGGFDVGGHH
jgi:hypothetical protein